MPVEIDYELDIPEVDPDDYLEELGAEDDYNPVPDEYVGLLIGPKGGGKDLTLATICFRAMYYQYPIYTNIHFFPDELKRLGIKEEYFPKKLTLDYMVSFDKSLEKCVIAISEIDTWIIKSKANANLNIILTSFLKQIRKKGVKFFGSLHSDDAMPGEIQKEVDLIIECKDAFYTDWGKENMVSRGKMIFQNYYDRTGVFTGHRGQMFGSYYTARSENVWRIYDSFQVYDPFVGFQKVQFEGNEITLDLSNRNQDTILSLWKLDVIDVVLDNPEKCEASMFNDGVNTWFSFNPRKTTQIARHKENFQQISDDLEVIRGMRTKTFVRASRDGRGKMSIQTLPHLVPQLEEILGKNE